MSELDDQFAKIKDIPGVDALLRGEAVIVPKEPTVQQCVEGCDVLLRKATFLPDYQAVYKAMLEASPYAQKESE